MKEGIILMVFLSMFLSCKKKQDFKEQTLGNTTVQVFEKKDEDNTHYLVRIVSDPHSDLGEAVKRKMYYECDSSFLVKDFNQVEILASAVEPVANGQKNIFEYMVYFEGEYKEPHKLIYYDKYLSGNDFVFEFDN